jgi:hypothetical protein
LQGFSDAATPTFAALGKAAPSFTEATRLLTPFSAASTVSLKSLGATGEEAGPTLRAADPVVRKTSQLALTGVSPTTNLAKFFASTKETKGFDALVDLIYNFTAASNGFDRYGHFTRTLVTLTNCLEYELEQSSCSAKFTGVNAGQSSLSSADLQRLLQEQETREAGEVGGTLARPEEAGPSLSPSSPIAPEAPEIAQGRKLGTRSNLPAPRRQALLDYLLGP